MDREVTANPVSEHHAADIKLTDMRAVARAIFQSAVAAADPARAVQRHLSARPLGSPSENGKTYLLALGKAAPAMMAEALLHVPAASEVRALVVTNSGNIRDEAGCRMIEGDHPVPGAKSHFAGREVMSFVTSLRAQDHLVALISGGGSSLITVPAKGVSLAEKASVTAMMISQGFDISEINMVRQSLSRVKGGKLAALAAPASVRSIILSDVIGDDVRAIASGPTTGVIATRTEVLTLLKTRGVFQDLPRSVKRLLSLPDDGFQCQKDDGDATVIGSNRLSLEAACQYASSNGWPATIVNDCLTGDVGAAAEIILSHTQNVKGGGPQALIFGGETTVVLHGNGKGGRNQELALRVALAAGKLPRNFVFLSGGTDGRDGPTDAAGGLVDQGTLSRMSAQGVNINACLTKNDSYTGLDAASDLLKTGPTGTNVADVQIMLVAGEATDKYSNLAPLIL